MSVAASTISGAPIEPDSEITIGKFATTTVIGAAAATTIKTIPGTPRLRWSVDSIKGPCYTKAAHGILVGW